MTALKNRTIAYDCRYFLGDRPCIWHKQEGLLCLCQHYTRSNESMLMIKLDAMGDVLRTTSLLPAILSARPGIRISWITRRESVPLLENNPYLSEVIAYSADAFTHLFSRTFDRVVNLDAGKISAGMASIAKAKEKTGYILNENGYVTGTNAAADEWLRMGVFDDLKRANRRSYQEIMCSILGIPAAGFRYIFELTEKEREQGRSHFVKLGLDLNKNIIGIHTGGGGRWHLKQWQEERFVNLVNELRQEHGAELQLVLFGGGLEREMNKRIMAKAPGITVDAGCDNEIRHFAALINCCTVVLSADSLAMHVAIALGRRVVVLFGPTSSAEIDLFGLGEKVIPALDCLGCYKKTCNYTPNCMESISVDMVKKVTLKQLSHFPKPLLHTPAPALYTQNPGGAYADRT